MATPRISQISRHLGAAPMDALDNEGRGSRGIYEVLEEPLGTTRHVRIVTIGAGASGLNLIRTLRKGLSDFEHVVYEKNEKIGGTWFENRYPGCRCDIPSHNYQFSWRPNPEWTNFFSPAAEIQAYLCLICEEENMSDTIKLSHEVLKAVWNETNGAWALVVRNLVTDQTFTDYAHFLVDSSGILNKWTWPDIPGLREFKGDMIHSASWPKDYQHAGKSVAVIGNGSSAVQIIPEIQPSVRQLVHVFRSLTWIVPPRLPTLKMGRAGEALEKIELDAAANFSPEQIEIFKRDPGYYRAFVKAIEREVNSNFPIIVKDSPMQELAVGMVRQYMTVMLGGDERLCEMLIPTFPLGCRRMTPAPGYLESLRASNTRLVPGGVSKVVPDGIELESGEVIHLDSIICATGFDLSFLPKFDLVGRNGNLKDIWRDSTPKAYMSCAVAGMPNYFCILGPNAPIGHGSVFTLSEHIAKYITRIIRKCQTEGIKAVAPTESAVGDFAEHIAKFMPRTAWASKCRSWFKGGKEDGPVTALHPGSRIHFFHMLEQFRGEDFEYVYDNPSHNRFHYLGNGFSTKELDEDIDSTWYLDEENAVY